jgi:hypothetical protein
MSNSVSTQRPKNRFLTTFTIFIGLLLGGTANAGFGEPGTVWNPTTAKQALEWSVANRGQCPLFPAEWRSGSTLDLEIPEIKVKSEGLGVAVKIGERHFIGNTRTTLWLTFGNSMLGGNAVDNLKRVSDVFEYCQTLYNINKTKAWEEATNMTGPARMFPWMIGGLGTAIPVDVLSQNEKDPSVIRTVAGVGILTTLVLNRVGKHIASKQLQNSEIPNLFRQLFVKAQAQEKRARDLAVQCESGSDQLTMETDTATLEQSVKDCRAAKAAYEPQHHAWQTKKVYHKLLRNEVAAILLIEDKNTLAFSTACDSAGKTSRTKLRNYDALKLSKTLLKCEHLAGLLKKTEGRPATASHYQTLGVLSASRVQAIIKRIKKAEKARQRRETAKQKAESAKQRKAAAAFLERLLSMSASSSTSSSSSAGEYRQSCTYENLMSISQRWPRVHTEYHPGGSSIKSVTFRVTTHIEADKVREIGCDYDGNGRIPGKRVEIGTSYFRVNFDW